MGRIVHLDRDGNLTEVANDLNYANGIAMEQTAGFMSQEESYAGSVTSFAIGDDGSLSDRQSFVHLYQTGGSAGSVPGWKSRSGRTATSLSA